MGGRTSLPNLTPSATGSPGSSRDRVSLQLQQGLSVGIAAVSHDRAGPSPTTRAGAAGVGWEEIPRESIS